MPEKSNYNDCIKIETPNGNIFKYYRWYKRDAVSILEEKTLSNKAVDKKLANLEDMQNNFLANCYKNKLQKQA